MSSSSKAHQHVAAIIVAAGDGSRMGGPTPKAYRHLGGKAMVEYSIHRFLATPQVTSILLVHNTGHSEHLTGIKDKYPSIDFVAGGKTRQESVHNALEYLADSSCDIVLIHDAARPFISQSTITKVIDALAVDQAAIPVIPVSDTVKKLHESHIENTVDRTSLALAQTPQGFHYKLIRELHQQYHKKHATDDVQLAEWATIPVRHVSGEKHNFKLTYEDDWKMAEKQLANEMITKVGMGFDVHKLVSHDESTPQRHRVIRLGGIDIPSEFRLEGHSDADVLLHAITDAILGALAEGDIGTHFPPTDPKWRGADSSHFLIEAKSLCNKYKAILQHVDVTLIAQQPKVSPHRETIRKRIAEILNLDLSCMSIKATTCEGLGFTGRGEGIAAQAVVTLSVPALSVE